jgi:Tol biopolymer transport system component
MAMRGDLVDAAIDDVAGEMTAVKPNVDLKAHVLTRIAAGGVPRRRSLMPLAGIIVALPAVALVGFILLRPRSPIEPQQEPAAAQLRSLVWVDRVGREEPVGVSPAAYESVRLSPSGQRVAMHIAARQTDVWLFDFARKALTRLTFGPAADEWPLWSPDERGVVFSSVTNGVENLFWRAADGTGSPQRLTASPNRQIPQSFSPHGRVLVYQEQAGDGPARLYLLRLEDPSAPSPLLASPFSVSSAEVSKDGRWLAYSSNASGRSEIYLQPFQSPGGKWQLSTGGGTSVRWRADGRELFYVSRGRMMAVRLATTGPTLEVSPPALLFDGPFSDSFDVTPDGERFLMIRSQQE